MATASASGCGLSSGSSISGRVVALSSSSGSSVWGGAAGRQGDPCPGGGDVPCYQWFVLGSGDHEHGHVVAEGGQDCAVAAVGDEQVRAGKQQVMRDPGFDNDAFRQDPGGVVSADDELDVGGGQGFCGPCHQGVVVTAQGSFADVYYRSRGVQVIQPGGGFCCAAGSSGGIANVMDVGRQAL